MTEDKRRLVRVAGQHILQDAELVVVDRAAGRIEGRSVEADQAEASDLDSRELPLWQVIHRWQAVA